MRAPRKLKPGVRNGLPFLVEVVAALKEEPMSAKNARAKFGRAPLRALAELGVLRIAGWERPGARGGWAVVYGVGSEPNEPPPVNRHTGGLCSHRICSGRAKPSPNAIAFSVLWKALDETPHTLLDLVEVSGMTPVTVGRFLRAAKRRRLVRVATWEKHFRIWVAAYKLGTWSVPRPAPQTKEEKRERSLQRQRGRALTLNTIKAIAAKSSRFRTTVEPELDPTHAAEAAHH